MSPASRSTLLGKLKSPRKDFRQEIVRSDLATRGAHDLPRPIHRNCGFSVQPLPYEALRDLQTRRKGLLAEFSLLEIGF